MEDQNVICPRIPNVAYGSGGQLVAVLSKLRAWLRFIVLLEVPEDLPPFTIGQYGFEGLIMGLLAGPVAWVTVTRLVSGFGWFGWIISLIVYCELVIQGIHAYACLKWLH